MMMPWTWMVSVDGCCVKSVWRCSLRFGIFSNLWQGTKKRQEDAKLWLFGRIMCQELRSGRLFRMGQIGGQSAHLGPRMSDSSCLDVTSNFPQCRIHSKNKVLGGNTENSLTYILETAKDNHCLDWLGPDLFWYVSKPDGPLKSLLTWGFSSMIYDPEVGAGIFSFN